MSQFADNFVALMDYTQLATAGNKYRKLVPKEAKGLNKALYGWNSEKKSLTKKIVDSGKFPKTFPTNPSFFHLSKEYKVSHKGLWAVKHIILFWFKTEDMTVFPDLGAPTKKWYFFITKSNFPINQFYNEPQKIQIRHYQQC